MVLDREPDCTDTVLNIDTQEHTLIIHALEDVTISLLDGDFPSGTLRMKAGQVIMFPSIIEEDLLALLQEFEEDE
jgi:hypothetical protein